MAVPATSPTSSYAGTGTTEELEQKVMESASSVLKFMKDRRTAQASTGKITKGTHPTSTVLELHERQINTTESEELVTLRERLVFRSNVPIPADSLFLLQQSYKDAEALINKYLASNAETTPLAREILGEAVLECPEEDKILLRCALREFHEARLKSQSQIAGITPPEVRQLELLEEVWKAHGVPNGCEMGLLMEATGHRLHYLGGWLGDKQRGSRAIAALGRKMFPDNDALLRLRYRREVRPYLKKPYTRH
ncbi:MAG: hypothetical protein Q9178_000149 [Gyalolechia marmorata]